MMHTINGKNEDYDGNFEVKLVFRINMDERRLISHYTRVLYNVIEDSDILDSPLPVSSTAVVLRGIRSCGKNMGDDEFDFRSHEAGLGAGIKEAKIITDRILQEYRGRKISLVGDQVADVNGTGPALLLRPATDDDAGLLDEICFRFHPPEDDSYDRPEPYIPLACYTQDAIDAGKTMCSRFPLSREKAPVFECSIEQLTVRVFRSMYRFIDIPFRVCVMCDGARNRSPLAAGIINDLARLEPLSVIATARAACRGTEGLNIRDSILDIMYEYEIPIDSDFETATYLEDKEVPCFSYFVAISEGAINRLAMLQAPDDMYLAGSQIFYGVPDPEYNTVDYDVLYDDILRRAGRFILFFVKEYDDFIALINRSSLRQSGPA